VCYSLSFHVFDIINTCYLTLDLIILYWMLLEWIEVIVLKSEWGFFEFEEDDDKCISGFMFHEWIQYQMERHSGLSEIAI